MSELLHLASDGPVPPNASVSLIEEALRLIPKYLKSPRPKDGPERELYGDIESAYTRYVLNTQGRD